MPTTDSSSDRGRKISLPIYSPSNRQSWRDVSSRGTSPKYNFRVHYNHPIERCWGILELKWNGTKLIDAETMLEWAKRMTWKGLHPVVELSHKGYQKGIALGKAAMQAVEKRLERHPALPKYDILINPAPTS